MSLEQYAQLIEGLLETPSGGRFPVMLAESTFAALSSSFHLDWGIEVQGINVADKPSGAGADIVVKEKGKILLAAEVTERAVDKTRVVSTFQTKIAPQGIEDYLFLVTTKTAEDVMKQARNYFSQGHEINFLELKNWILVVLATSGKRARVHFNYVLLDKLQAEDVPAALKTAWNKQIERITGT